MIDLAIAVVIGGAFGKIVTALVNDLIMPVVGALMPSGEWRNFTVTSLNLKVGDFLGSIVDFCIVAFVLFLVVVKMMGALKRKQPESAPTSRPCPECLENIPLSARRCRACGQLVAAAVAMLVLFALPGRALAQDPKFEFGKAEEVKTVEWKAQAKAGFILTTGNSETATVTAGTSLSRKEAGNKFSFDGGLAYARSSILIGVADTMGNITAIQRDEQTTANSWFAKARYDRFFTQHNSGYVSANFSGDQVAGKDLVAGGQVGYSRQLYKTDRNELVAEIGYDFSYESYTGDVDSVAIHSLRLFAGDTTKITAATSFFANIEGLFNLNTETKALKPDGMGGAVAGVDAFDDTRVNFKAGLTTTIWKNISLSLSYTVKYDHAPAPLPAFKTGPFAEGFQPFADTTDTITEAALIVNFL